MSQKTGTLTSTKQGLDDSIKIQQLFKVMVDNNASDLHLTVGSPPAIRVSGEIVKVKLPRLSQADTKRLIFQILSEEQKNDFEKNLELDFSFGIKGLARFRSNIFYSKGGMAAVFRQIPSIVPDFESLNMPHKLIEITDASNGLILITGPTGSGKSTTLASLINHLNKNEAAHIITLEDPIEFVHQHRASIVNQREIGSDSLTFTRAIKSLLRQDPDIVLVGELRDTETIEAALTIAETGHLVFGTLHTNSTVQTINRIINVFPSHQQSQIRTLLSFVLQGVVAQQLVPKSFESGRICVQEILIPTPAVRNLIREDKSHQIYSQMQIGQDKTGMVTMNQNLIKAVESGQIDNETAISYSNNPEEILKKLGMAK